MTYKFRAYNLDRYEMHSWEHLTDYFDLNFLFKNEAIIPMQFTGVKDINGTEIYEGDILEVTMYSDICLVGEEKRIVVFKQGCFLLEDMNKKEKSEKISDVSPYRMIIIGDKYEQKGC